MCKILEALIRIILWRICAQPISLQLLQTLDKWTEYLESGWQIDATLTYINNFVRS